MGTGEAALVDPEWLRWFRENKHFFALGTDTLSVYVALDDSLEVVDKHWEIAGYVYQKLKEASLIISPEIEEPEFGNPIILSTGSIILSVRTNVKAETLKKDWENAEAVYHFLKERGLIRSLELPRK